MSTNRWHTPARRLAALGIPLATLVLAWREVDPRAGASLLARVGPLLAIALLPYTAVITCDVLGWRRLLSPALRRRLGWRNSFAARLAGESVARTMAWAGLGGEIASSWFATRRAAVPLGRSLGSLLVRRLLLAPCHGAIVVVAALAILACPSLPRPLAAAALAAGMLLVLLGTAGVRLLRRGTPLGRLQVGLSQHSWLSRRLDWPSLRLAAADREMRRLLSGAWQPRTLAAGFFFLFFAAEVGESWVLLRLLGARLTPLEVLAIEPIVSLARGLAVFAPAGLGVQELGYVSLLHLAGVPGAVAIGPAFVLLKRMQEVVWTTTGWALLAACGASRAELRKGRRLEPRTAEDPVHLRFAEPDHADAPDRAPAAGA